jgi:hypothetical protein
MRSYSYWNILKFGTWTLLHIYAVTLVHTCIPRKKFICFFFQNKFAIVRESGNGTILINSQTNYLASRENNIFFIIPYLDSCYSACYTVGSWKYRVVESVLTFRSET